MKTLKQYGYSLIEVLVIITLFIILSGLTTITLLNSQHTASSQAALVSFITDVKGQQVKAMQGDTEGRNSPDYYGIHIASTSYTLFHGISFNPADSTNLTIPLDGTLQFNSVTFTNSNIIFIPISGEIYGYSSAANTLVLQDTTNQQKKTLQFNYLGVLTNIN